ncbi:hypothetical protein [Mesorhizobium sp. M0520]
MVNAARNGFGVAYLPEHMVESYIAAGEMRRPRSIRCRGSARSTG